MEAKKLKINGKKIKDMDINELKQVKQYIDMTLMPYIQINKKLNYVK